MVITPKPVCESDVECGAAEIAVGSPRTVIFQSCTKIFAGPRHSRNVAFIFEFMRRHPIQLLLLTLGLLRKKLDSQQ